MKTSVKKTLATWSTATQHRNTSAGVEAVEWGTHWRNQAQCSTTQELSRYAELTYSSFYCRAQCNSSPKVAVSVEPRHGSPDDLLPKQQCLLHCRAIRTHIFSPLEVLPDMEMEKIKIKFRNTTTQLHSASKCWHSHPTEETNRQTVAASSISSLFLLTSYFLL